MGFILVIAQNPHIRRFCVDNLVIRGYPTVGVANAIDEGKALLKDWIPECILLCGEPEQFERDLRKIRALEHPSLIPLIIISREKPSLAWMAAWKVSAFIQSFPDTRELVSLLKPWLFTRVSA